MAPLASKKSTPKAKQLPPPPPATLQSVSGFMILPVRLTELEHLHYLYFKKHDVRKEEDTLPANRTLFVTNLPETVTEANLTELFEECGSVERIKFNSLRLRSEPLPIYSQTLEELLGTDEEDSVPHGEGAIAYVVFAAETSIAAALKMRVKDRSLIDSNPLRYGVHKYLREYERQRPDPDTLQAKVDDFVIDFEDKEQQIKKRVDKVGKADADGFITVTRHTRRNRNVDSASGAIVTAARAEDTKKLHQKKKELVDFYRFQMRQAKRDDIAELRRKFEEDKKKIERMKAARKFKPY